MMIKRLCRILTAGLSGLFLACVRPVPFSCAEEAPVILGDEQFNEYLPLLEGKRAALFTNHSGIVGDKTDGAVIPDGQQPDLIPFGRDDRGNEVTYGQHILDALLERGVNVTAVFSPEHGFRGTADAGESVDSSVDEQTGVPLLSLFYEGSHYPSPESMECFDTLVVDIQDVGLRFYTYHLTLYYLMDACAQNDKDVIILDRPNPNGFYVDGPILRPEFASGVGLLPIPVVYGMTLGELAGMINGEGWLEAGKDACSLTVIPCRNYTHQTKASLIRNPSPNLKDMRAVYLYASVCFFENTACSVGRGTEYPFEVYGSPYLENEETCDFTFIPVSMPGAAAPPYEGVLCHGYDLRTKPLQMIWEEGIHLEYLIQAWEAVKKAHPEVSFFGVPDEKGRYWIDKLSGTDQVRLMIEAGKTAEEIKAAWQDEIQRFREQRRLYLLYKE